MAWEETKILNKPRFDETEYLIQVCHDDYRLKRSEVALIVQRCFRRLGLVMKDPEKGIEYIKEIISFNDEHRIATGKLYMRKNTISIKRKKTIPPLDEKIDNSDSPRISEQEIIQNNLKKYST